jgi:uncharacterized membrane protein YphA (DoxX/SURF4 family)
MPTFQFERIAPVILRVGLGLVFIWFGTHQLMDPAMWVGFIPDYATNPFFTPETLVKLNGFAELIGAFMLMTGLWLRPLGILLCLHMLMIAVDAGGAIGTRDFGLATACLTLAMMLPDEWSLDAILKN